MAIDIVPPTGASTLSPAQSRLVLQTIAGQAATLNQLLMRVQEYCSQLDPNAAVQLDAAQLIAQTIGGLADSASGEEIIGSPERWHFGEGFATIGMGVQHG